MKGDVAQVVDATPDALKIVLLKNEKETIVKVKDCVPYINVQDVMADLGLKSNHEDCVFRTDIILNMLSRSRDTTFSSESSKEPEDKAGQVAGADVETQSSVHQHGGRQEQT